MKPLLLTGCLLLALAHAKPAYAQEANATANTEAAAYFKPQITHNGYGYESTVKKDTTFTINFTTPMIAEDALETAPTAGYAEVYYSDTEAAIPHTAEWVSASELELTITADTDPMKAVTVRVPAGIQDTEGHTYAEARFIGHTSDGIMVNCNGNYPEKPRVLFLGGTTALDSELLEQRISTLYFKLGDKVMPANIRPATAADAVAHWVEYKEAFEYEMPDRDSTDMAALPPDTPLPHTWVCELPFYPSANQKLELILPEAERPRDMSVGYKDKCLYSFTPSAPRVYLTNTAEGLGKNRVNLTFYQPALVTDIPAVLRSLEWQVHDYNHNADPVPLKWHEDNTLRATIRSQEVVIRIDEEATAKHIRSYQLSDGRTVQGVSEVVLHADLGGENAPSLTLTCSGHYESITGQTTEKGSSDTTDLTPRSPFIHSDVTNGHMMSGGATTINCEYGRIKNGQVRICKIAGDGPSVVSAINAYEAWYDDADNKHVTWEQTGQIQNSPSARVNRMHAVPVDMLPGIEQEVTYPLESAYGTTKINLTQPFGHADKTGLYLVEISGESLRRDDYSAPIVNQGLVQVTDLGLMWKLNGKRLFAWGYHLSDGKEIAEGTLYMLDAKGKTLAELPLSQGVACGDFPAETRFFRLCTANDSVVVMYNPLRNESDASYSWDSERLAQLGIPADELPQALIYTFKDRSIYRPGEVAHIKGMVRWVRNNELHTPEIESITATIRHKNKEQVVSVTPAADGSFTLDVTTQGVGSHSVQFDIKYKGDDNGTSPDYAALARYNVSTEDWYVKHNLLNESRRNHTYLTVEEFRRNEFEVESEMTTDWAERTVEIDATATNFTTTPVADGKVHWRVYYYRYNFYPAEWQEYRFGDFRENTWAHFSAYYLGIESAGSGYICSDSFEDKLDAEGSGACVFDIPQEEEFNRGRIAITGITTVTNGNEQSLKSTREIVIDPCEVYAGIKTEQRLLQVGQKLPVSIVAVCPDGKAWQGAPLQGNIKVVRTSHKAYRYGSASASGVHNVKEEEVVWDAPVAFSGTPNSVEIPLQHAGIYTIEATCTDTKGNTNTSAVRHYVWGDDVSPWYYEHGSEITMVPDKDMYNPGDTAHILVQTPIDAEVLVTVERGKVLRHYKRTVTVSHPVIEVPVEAGDAPVVYVSVSLIQSANDRKKDGEPMLKMGVCSLNVATPEKVLSVELTAPETHLLPTDTCEVSGVVRDAAGNPVPHADVTLYAEDEGTLQVLGYALPCPQYFFYSQAGRPHGVNTYSALGQLYGENMKHRYMGNKGVFIGGGGEGGGYGGAVSDEEADYLRENFNPCALWLGSIKTDENGCFRASYVNPDTLTRYRVMAVAADRDRFGSAKTAYHVTKPIMLEPIAPNGATEGDLLHLPVTVSMLPEQLAEAANGNPVEWKVSISGTNVTLPEPEKTVRLTGNEPVTITFPVKMNSTGTAELQWRVQAATPGSSARLAACKDAVKLEFEVIPPTPFLRERVFYTLTDAGTINLHDLVKTAYRAESPVELTFSTSPLMGLRYHLQYLLTYPYGCSEQLSSAVIPWILKPELEEALGMQLPTDKNREDVMADTFERLNKRYKGNGQYGYWDNSTEPSEYSAYVILVCQLALEHHVNATGIYSYRLDNMYSALEAAALPEDTQQDIRLGGFLTTAPKAATVPPRLLNLYVLARAGRLSHELLDKCIARTRSLQKVSPAQRWMLALCARMCNHPEAAALMQEAVAADAEKKPEYYYSYDILPPVEIIRLLYAIADAPKAQETAEAMRDFLDSGSLTYSTWRNAWTTIAVHEFMKHADMQNKVAVVNGQSISTKQPLILTTPYGINTAYSTQGDTVYITGYAEGHTAQAQPVQAINEGLKVTRRFEKLLPDGSWQPTATFAVGDVVKVHLTVEADAAVPPHHLRYLVVEDRLPAAFEAVNPALSSQALPPHVTAEQARGWWYWGSCIDNKEFLKDRVRFFATYMGSGKMEATYVARVLRRGEVTAPATKAELMYRPEVRGLSIPQQLHVK